MFRKLKIKYVKKLLIFRKKDKYKFYTLIVASIVVGFLTGIGAVILKNSVHYLHSVILPICNNNNGIFLLFFPIIGMLLTFFYVKITKFKIKPGVPNLLFSISQNQGFLKSHNMFSSIIGAVLTVGFGTPAGLESPNITTGAGIGSSISKLIKLNYRDRILLLGVAAAGTISAIFKAPITGIFFALEVVMIDLTSASIIPIVLASITASLTSYLILGANHLYALEVINKFNLNEVPYFILMGVLMALAALFFTTINQKIKKITNKIKSTFVKFLLAGIISGILVFLFPAIFAEGYGALNSSIKGDYSYLYLNNIFDNTNNMIIFFLCIAIVKMVATSIVVSAGGIGGFFTPILFAGINIGLFLSHLFERFGVNMSHENSALVGMGGLVSAMMHAPLTGVFFIGEITGGYSLLFPLLITSAIAYMTIRIFQKHSFYAIDLAKEKTLLTHHADLNVLTMLKLQKLIEVSFVKLKSEAKLGDLVEAVKISSRDLFPIVDDKNNFLGVISLNKIRKMMFKTELYDKISVNELMIYPSVYVELNEHLSEVAEKFEKTKRFNLLVLDKGKYVGFISRSNFFLHYRNMLTKFSAH